VGRMHLWSSVAQGPHEQRATKAVAAVRLPATTGVWYSRAPHADALPPAPMGRAHHRRLELLLLLAAMPGMGAVGEICGLFAETPRRCGRVDGAPTTTAQSAAEETTGSFLQ
jgi:hypothetical protein